MKSVFEHVKITGISTVVPKKSLCLVDEKDLYNGDQKRIDRVIKSSGFLKRRVSDASVTTSDLCFEAAENLLQNLMIDRNSIDGLIFLSYTPDYLMPATSYVLHKRLRLSQNCVVMDIPQACSGYVIGLLQSSMLLNAGCRRVLLLVGDSFSKFSDMFKDNTAPVFGDAGSATLVDFDKNAEKIYFNINSDGNGYENLICNNGGFRNPPQKDDFYSDGRFKYNAKMNGGKIFDFTINNVALNIKELLEFANYSADAFDYYLFHQANKFILQNIAMQLNIDCAKMPIKTLSEYGNQCGASIPCTISDNIREIVCKNSLNCLLAGFGAGLSWASAIVNLDKIYCSGILEYGENQ